MLLEVGGKWQSYPSLEGTVLPAYQAFALNERLFAALRNEGVVSRMM